jgi:ribosomal protein S18 acetylase RimI-like enzyme
MRPTACSPHDSVASFEARIEPILPWLHEAGNPYWDWLWGSPTEARRQLKGWLARSSSELSAEHVVCLTDGGGHAVGGYVALPGRTVQICRRADLLALRSYLQRSPDASRILARLGQARSLFANVAETEFYLSRIGVLASARAQGLGRRLLEMFVEDGRRKGFSKFRLDVSADNAGARRLYRAAGFVEEAESAIAETPLRYVSMVMSASPRCDE